MQDTKDVSVFILLFQIQHLSRYHAMKRLEELELKPGQAGILFTLNVEGVLSQRQAGQENGVKTLSAAGRENWDYASVHDGCLKKTGRTGIRSEGA